VAEDLGGELEFVFGLFAGRDVMQCNQVGVQAVEHNAGGLDFDVNGRPIEAEVFFFDHRCRDATGRHAFGARQRQFPAVRVHQVQDGSANQLLLRRCAKHLDAGLVEVDDFAVAVHANGLGQPLDHGAVAVLAVLQGRIDPLARVDVGNHTDQAAVISLGVHEAFARQVSPEFGLV